MAIRVQGGDNYDPREFLTVLKDYMLTPPPKDPHNSDPAQVAAHNDTYLDIYLRRFFANLSDGLPMEHCARNQRDQWSIGSIDGISMCIPVAVAYFHLGEAAAVARAIEQHMLTHRSVAVTTGVAAVVPLLHALIAGGEVAADAALRAAMRKLKPPKISGESLLGAYRAARGPGNIPARDKWDQHAECRPETLDVLVARLVADGRSDESVVGPVFSTMCYVEQALPVLLLLLPLPLFLPRLLLLFLPRVYVASRVIFFFAVSRVSPSHTFTAKKNYTA